MPASASAPKLPPLQEYAAYLRELMKRSIAHPTNPDAPLTGFKIVVDPGNGGGAFIADQVLSRMEHAAFVNQFLRCRVRGGLVSALLAQGT